MKWPDEGRFRWWYAFFGSLAAVFLVLAKDQGVSSPAGFAAFACLAAIPLLMLIERRHDIAGWLRGSPHGRRFRPIAIASSFALCLIGFMAGSQIPAEDGASATQGSALYAKGLNDLLADLTTKRAHAYRDLASTNKRATQERVASELGDAFRSAASALRGAGAPPADLDANRLIIQRLRAVAAAYAGVGKAAVASPGSQTELDGARHYVDVETWRLWAAEKALGRDRYRILGNTPSSHLVKGS